ncbi:hypothetical protein Tdes44962_MAKER01291 [Teratosphaeria destructans]|uniref:Uncharacterized protein n=1 Tax=Teratosphaeria destructans TaxID=418781 RepID=A0A9W7T101_9PEZI|nr:hypothetical protein Tdes44962_MAKER01291 [Teratosphaeria destructans]
MATVKRPANRSPSPSRKRTCTSKNHHNVNASENQSSSTLQSTEVATPQPGTILRTPYSGESTLSSQSSSNADAQNTQQRQNSKWFHGRKGVLSHLRRRDARLVIYPVVFQVQDLDIWKKSSPDGGIIVYFETVNMQGKLGFYYPTLWTLRRGLEQGLQLAFDERYGTGQFRLESWHGNFVNNESVTGPRNRTAFEDESLKSRKHYQSHLRKATEILIWGKAVMVSRSSSSD